MNRLLASILAAIGLFWAMPAARADTLRPGYLEFTQIDATQWRLVWKAPMGSGITPQTQPILPDGCAVAKPLDRRFVEASMISTMQVQCSGPVDGGAIGLSNFATSQTDVLVRVAPLDRPVQILRLTPANPSAAIAAKPQPMQVAKAYFILGVEHILIGFDHLLFVLALVLLLTGFWTIAKAVTAFTIAHSITLIGTSLGFLGLPQRPVEALIALSILFLAVEIVKKTGDEKRLSEQIPWLVAFLFGLLHGFGFAGALKEIGLPESDVTTALLTFNLGVEAGQLLIVAVAALVLLLCRRVSPRLERPAIKIATYGIGTIAAFWLFERTIR